MVDSLTLIKATLMQLDHIIAINSRHYYSETLSRTRHISVVSAKSKCEQVYLIILPYYASFIIMKAVQE